MRRREGGGEAMVRGEEAVAMATADEMMGEAEGGRRRRRARRRSASGGRGRTPHPCQRRRRRCRKGWQRREGGDRPCIVVVDATCINSIITSNEYIFF